MVWVQNCAPQRKDTLSILVRIHFPLGIVGFFCSILVGSLCITKILDHLGNIHLRRVFTSCCSRCRRRPRIGTKSNMIRYFGNNITKGVFFLAMLLDLYEMSR